MFGSTLQRAPQPKGPILKSTKVIICVIKHKFTETSYEFHWNPSGQNQDNVMINKEFALFSPGDDCNISHTDATKPQASPQAVGCPPYSLLLLEVNSSESS